MNTKVVLRYLFVLIFIGSGIAHLVKPDIYLHTLPAFFPYPDLLVSVSGVFEIVVGIGLLLEKYRQWASWVAVAMLFAFLAVHISHVESNGKINEETSIPVWFSWVRLILQGVLMYGAWWIGQPDIEEEGD